MKFRTTALERAFELARSGKCLTIHDIALKLHSEKYDVSYLEGPALKQQLRELIEEALNAKKLSDSEWSEQKNFRDIDSSDTGI